MQFADTAKNQMLDALTVDRIRLHSGDPGASGTDNAVGSLTAASFASASGGELVLSAPVQFTGLDANQTVTWFSIWLNSGTVFKGRGPITSGDTQANAAGEFTLTTTTKLAIADA